MYNSQKKVLRANMQSEWKNVREDRKRRKKKQKHFIFFLPSSASISAAQIYNNGAKFLKNLKKQTVMWCIH